MRSPTDPNPERIVRPATVRRFAAGRLSAPERDVTAIEAPLAIHVEGEPVAVTLRTPGDDDALVRGFLFTDGWVDHPEDVRAVRTDEAGDMAHVRLAAGVPRPLVRRAARRAARRGTLMVAACGLCGRLGLQDLLDRLQPPPPAPPIRPSLLVSAPEALKAVQPGFARTGGLHAAVALDAAGRVLAGAEDVGRHNAVDKVIGTLLRSDPLLRHPAALLAVSGRASFEIVAKAAAARIGAVAAVSAPSSAAVELADSLGMLLAGFVRAGRFNLYCGEARLCASEAG